MGALTIRDWIVFALVEVVGLIVYWLADKNEKFDARRAKQGARE